jgi:hypothetical protein
MEVKYKLNKNGDSAFGYTLISEDPKIYVNEITGEHFYGDTVSLDISSDTIPLSTLIYPGDIIKVLSSRKLGTYSKEETLFMGRVSEITKKEDGHCNIRLAEYWIAFSYDEDGVFILDKTFGHPEENNYKVWLDNIKSIELLSRR